MEVRRLAFGFDGAMELQLMICNLKRLRAYGKYKDEEKIKKTESCFSNRSEGSNGCSECSCGEADCEHRIIDAGPNQVNFLAATNEIIEAEVTSPVEAEVNISEKKDLEDQYDVLKRVIGNLESMADKKKPGSDVKTEKDSNIDETSQLNFNNVQEERKSEYRQIENDQQIQAEREETTVEGSVPRRTAEFEEISTLQRDREKLRGKLKRSEQELEELKAANITIKEEREQLRKKVRSMQDAFEHRNNLSQSPIPSPSPTPSAGSNRTNSLPRQAHMVSLRTAQVVSCPTMESRRTSLQSQPSLQSSSSSPFTPVPSKKSAGSPASTLQRQNIIGPSSDLGSSVGDEAVMSELSETLVRILRTRIPETLLQTLLTYNRLDQVLESLHMHYNAEVMEKKRELELQAEHLTSKLSHLKSQNDLLQLCLEESKGNCERLSLLVGKYESKDTALRMALQNTDQIIEAYEVMLQLQESEQDLLVASYRNNVQPFTTDTMKSLTSTNSSKSNVSGASSLTSNSHYQLTYADDIADDEDGTALYQNSQTKRRDAESHAKNLLHKLDRKYEVTLTGSTFLPFDENFDFNSRTSTLSSANSSNFETLSKEEEMRLKEYVQLLKTERSTVQTTVVELESVTDVLEHFDDSNIEQGDKGSLDLETAVLLQELQALKEERAELKHRIFMLEKEKKALELKLSSREAQEQGYIAHIEYLKSEVKEQAKKRKQILKEERKLRGSTQDDDAHSSTSGNTGINMPLADLRSAEDDIPRDLYEAARREKKLKARIQELVDTLEKLSKNSEIRHQQTAEYVSDLKRANGALISAYEKAKKRHATKLKKFESQLITMAERHQEQTKLLKERISKLSSEDEKAKQRRQNETSL